MIDLFAPSLAGDERLRRAWSRYERQAASPGATIAIVRLIYASDVRALLPTIRVPTLVIHRADARGFPVAHGRYLAAHIPGATYVELPGIDNLIWAGDQDAIVAEIQASSRASDPTPEPHARARDRPVHGHRRLDAVARPSSATPVGTALLDEHYRGRAASSIERFGGREVKTIGDGILATFDGPARAIRCARRDPGRACASSASRSARACTPARSRCSRTTSRASASTSRARILGARGQRRGARLEHGQGSRRRLRVHVRGPRARTCSRACPASGGPTARRRLTEAVRGYVVPRRST